MTSVRHMACSQQKGPRKAEAFAKFCWLAGLALLAERKGGLVGNNNAVGVQLQDRSRALGRNRAIAHIVHGLSLGFAVGDNQDHAGIHDRLSTHGVGLTGHVVNAVEQAAVGLNGALGKVDAVGALGEVVVGL